MSFSQVGGAGGVSDRCSWRMEYCGLAADCPRRCKQPTQTVAAQGTSRQAKSLCTPVFYFECGGRVHALVLSEGKTAMPNSGDADVRFYVADGPLATSVSEASESYFSEGLHAGRGGVRVVLSDGSTEFDNRVALPGAGNANSS